MDTKQPVTVQVWRMHDVVKICMQNANSKNVIHVER
jgi:hypothetical protein